MEFSPFPYTTNIRKEVRPSKNQILLVAGDTILSVALTMTGDVKAEILRARFDAFLDAVSGYKQVYMIAGNHEAYSYGDVATNKEIIVKYLEKRKITNVRFLENERVPLSTKIDLLACTLWTSMGNRNQLVLSEVGRMMNDFRISDYKKRPFTTSDCADLHFASKDWLLGELSDTSKSYVVMTHHLPSFQSIDPYFKGDMMNNGYASDMDDVILANPHIRLWVHGHTHFNTDYKIGETRIVSNQRGYPGDSRGNWKGFAAKEIKI